MTAIGRAQSPHSELYWRGRYERQATELERATQRIDDLERDARESYDAIVTRMYAEFHTVIEELRAELLKVRRQLAEAENAQAYAVHAKQRQCQYAWTVNGGFTDPGAKIIHCNLPEGHNPPHGNGDDIAPT